MLCELMPGYQFIIVLKDAFITLYPLPSINNYIFFCHCFFWTMYVGILKYFWVVGHAHVAEALGVPLHIFFTMPWTWVSTRLSLHLNLNAVSLIQKYATKNHVNNSGTALCLIYDRCLLHLWNICCILLGYWLI